MAQTLETHEGAIGDIEQTATNLKCSLADETGKKLYFSMFIENPNSFEMPSWAKNDGDIVKFGYYTTKKEYNGKEMTFRNIKKAKIVEQVSPSVEDLDDDLDNEDDGTDFNPADFEPADKPQTDVPIVDQNGNAVLEIDTQLDKASTTEAMLMNSIQTKLAKYDWFNHLPPEEKQKYAVSLYIEINTQRFTRWRKS